MSQRVTLDDTDMRARLRSHSHVSGLGYIKRQTMGPSRRLLQDIVTPQPKPIPEVKVVAKVVAKAASNKPARQLHPVQPHRPTHSAVLMRQIVPVPVVVPSEAAPDLRPSRFRPKLIRLPHFSLSRSTLLTSMAIAVFVAGAAVSIMGFRTNSAAQAQVAEISKTTDKTAPATTTGVADKDVPPPSTTPVPPATKTAYTVPADLPRYLTIPKLGVYARVLQVGLTASGAVATPTNVFDTAWYNGSSKPGQPGAMLIDGHVSSWTAHGVFYGIKTLSAGDQIKVQRGDGQTFTYQVVKTQVYDHNGVDMGAVMSPIDPSKPGLNLITCTGDVIRGTNEFNERVVVFATQTN